VDASSAASTDHGFAIRHDLPVEAQLRRRQRGDELATTVQVHGDDVVADFDREPSSTSTAPSGREGEAFSAVAENLV